jgi:glycosyltransferase involved in cell wall biosynthesis
MNRRILIFIPSFTHGGAEKQGVILAKVLREQGFDVNIWAFPPIGSISMININELISEGIQCFQFPNWPKYSWRFADSHYSVLRMFSLYFFWFLPLKRIKKITPKQTFDIIIPFTVPACLLSVLLKEQLKAKVVFWNHRGGNDTAGFNYSPFIIKKINEARSVLLANSSGGATFLKRIFNKSNEQINIINNFYISDFAKRSIKNKKLGPPQPVDLLQLANFFPEKDWDSLVEGMAILKKRNFSTHLHLVGSFINDIDKKRFKNKVLALGVDDMLTHYGSMSKHELIERFEGKIHIGVLSSKTEGMPNAVMEYMYWKLPVIGSDIPAIADLLGDSQKDFLFNVGDPMGFADAVQWITSDPKRFEDIGNNNHLRIIEHFSVDKIIPQWLELINGSMKND